MAVVMSVPKVGWETCKALVTWFLGASGKGRNDEGEGRYDHGYDSIALCPDILGSCVRSVFP